MANPDRPLLVTSDTGLRDAVVAVAAEAQVDVLVVNDVGSAVSYLASAPLVLLDAQLLPTASALDALSHWVGGQGLVIVTRAIDDPEVWRQVANVGAERVVELPQGAPWLFERLGRCEQFRAPQRASEPTGDVIAVLGAVGGAGTTSVATALARYLHDRSGSGVLVDLDPLGGGIDLLVGGETCSGARWDELAGISGRVDERVLMQALPTVAELPLLSWPPLSEVEPDVVAVEHVLDALCRARSPVVVDVGRGVDARSAAVFSRAARAVVVVPMRVRAVAAARRLLGRLPPHVQPLVLAREPAPGGLTAADLTSALNTPVVVTLPDDRRRAAIEELGGPAPQSAPWRRVCEALLEAQDLRAA
jgi:secretion/DNA translocation related CpaE-like protein